MGNFLFNVSRGRAHEMHRIIDENVLVNSALVLVVLKSVGLENDEILRDYDNLSLLLAASNDEPTQAQYARKVLTDVELAVPTINDTTDSVLLTYPAQTWTAVVAGDSWAKILTCIDYDTTTGTDVNIIPIVAHDMFVNGVPIVPSGVNIQWSVPSGYYLSQV